MATTLPKGAQGVGAQISTLEGDEFERLVQLSVQAQAPGAVGAKECDEEPPEA
jgi:hypothetical protein